MEHEAFTWFGMIGVPEKIATAGLVAAILVAFAAAVRPKLAAAGAVDPEDGVTSRNIAEVLAEAISGLAEGDHVIVYDQDKFHPGQPVRQRMINAPPPPKAP